MSGLAESLAVGENQRLGLYRVLKESGRHTRFEVAVTRGLTPFVGREPELALLLQRWAQVQDGLEQVIMLCGEPGIGKSRLVQVLKDRVARDAGRRIEWRGLPYYQHSAFSPVLTQLQRLLAWERDEAPEEKLHKLEAVFAQHPMGLDAVVPLLRRCCRSPCRSVTRRSCRRPSGRNSTRWKPCWPGSVALILTRGYTAPEVEATCAGARALCQDSGDTPHLFFPVYGLFLCSLLRGRLHAAREPAELHQGLAAYQTSGANGWRSYCLGIQAEAQGKGGQPTEGLRGVEDALALAGTAGEQPWYEAELYRRKGELLLAQADTRHRVDEAEACCSQALDVARRQQARALALRAALSLARLWRRQGKRTDAYQLLGEVYGWFTEGVDTADLREAKALLEYY